MDGLVLCLDGANYKSFKGEATTNYYSTPITLTSGRTGSTDGSIKTSFNTGGPTGGPFTRVVRDTSVSRTIDWEWQIDYSGTGLSNGNSFVVSFYARCPNGTLSSVRLSNPDTEGQTFNIDSTWRRFTASFTYGAQGGLTFFRVNRGHTPFYTNGATYDIANLQVEAKSYSTSFVDGTRGTTVATGGGWKDLIGSNSGELVNGVRESTDGGGSLVFDGNNDYVSLGTNPTGIDQVQVPLTICAWVKADAFGSYNPIWAADKSTSSAGLYSMIRVDGTTVRYFTSTSSGGFQYYAGSTLSTGTWYFLTVVVSGSLSSPTIAHYTNRSLVSSSTGYAMSSSPLSNVEFRIGANERTTNERLDGEIPIVLWYNKALSASEVQQNFNALRGRFGI